MMYEVHECLDCYHLWSNVRAPSDRYKLVLYVVTMNSPLFVSPPFCLIFHGETPSLFEA